MARRVFFSFHYERDVWRVNQVRNCNVVAGTDQAGFFDHSEYEEAKKKGDADIKRLIRRKLDGTSVTVVLIGTETASRPFVQYEVQESIDRKNGLLGIYIHHLKNSRGETDWFAGPKPSVPWNVDFPAYDWDGDLTRFRKAIEEAGIRADKLRTDA
jgi:hypothetical protein